MKLKNVRYLGKFYEINNKLGWMPYHQVLFLKIMGVELNWVPQKNVNFS